MDTHKHTHTMIDSQTHRRRLCRYHTDTGTDTHTNTHRHAHKQAHTISELLEKAEANKQQQA